MATSFLIGNITARGKTGIRVINRSLLFRDAQFSRHFNGAGCRRQVRVERESLRVMVSMSRRGQYLVLHLS